MSLSSVIVPRGERTEESGGRRYLGPAEVTRVSPHEVEVRLDGDRLVRARLAIGYPYDPQRGDTVLVIGDAGGHYVIGVLHGTGKTALEIPGDVELRAVGGTLRLSGDKGVEIAAPELSVRVDRLRTLAGSVVERFTSLSQRVAELLSVHAGQRHTVVDGSSHEQSKSATLLTEEKMTINGKAIHLG
jgi:Protein of unknown function (DUF3540)